MQTINPATLKQQVCLSGLLSRLGYEPVKPGKRELLYHSMLRADNRIDRTPSFSVNDELGVWYDHGTGKGGNLIDFGLAYWPGFSFSAVLAKLWETAQGVLLTAPPPRPARQRRAQKLPHYQVEKVCPIGTTAAVSQYLDYRGVGSVAAELLQEVHYYVRDEKQQVKHFFAAGHRNESGGREVRNKYFKGCLGHKGLTHYADDPRKLVVFEGYFDFLSWKFEHPDAKDSILVLNTLALQEAAIKVALRYPDITLYFDHDRPGRQATRCFIKALPYVTDGSGVFAGHHDYNDKRKAEARARREADKPKDYFKNVHIPFIR